MPGRILKRKEVVDSINIPFDATDNECWEWNGYIRPDGYGQAGKHLAHVRMWIIFRGIIPKKLCVLHDCDNRKCVNPNHLFLGTYKDNVRDMVKKERQLPYKKLLTHEQYNEAVSLLKEGHNYTIIAKYLNIDMKVLWNIINRPSSYNNFKPISV